MSPNEPEFDGSENLRLNEACALTVVQYSILSLRVIFLDSMNGCTEISPHAQIEPHYDGGRIADYSLPPHNATHPLMQHPKIR